MFKGFKSGKTENSFCQHKLWSRSVERASRLSDGQLDAWGTAICGHAMRLLEQGADVAEGADEVVLAGLSLMAIGMERQRRIEAAGRK
jgi:hypothetical protein